MLRRHPQATRIDSKKPDRTKTLRHSPAGTLPLGAHSALNCSNGPETEENNLEQNLDHEFGQQHRHFKLSFCLADNSSIQRQPVHATIALFDVF
jgi:hypothetical protein